MCIRPAALISVFLSISLPVLAAEQRLNAADRADRGVRIAGRHFILQPQHTLSDAERADLAANGCLIQRALPNGRYLVRLTATSPIDESDLRVRALTPLTAEMKIDSSAYRVAAAAKPFVRMKVLFQQDASLSDALSAVENAGGTVDSPMLLSFGPLRSLTVHIPSSALLAFASDERVLRVYGARTYRATSWNATAAAASNVTPLYSAPYNLSGSGVVLSYFELGPADASHVEFQGRLTVEFTCASTDTDCKNADNATHATHVAGTMIAAGINPAAKGMAPHATLHEYLGNNDTWLNDKATTIKNIGSVADNNSWGYVLGWNQDGSTGWTWEGGEELIGGYDGTLSAVLDHTALSNNVLMDHAAGNEAGVSGPINPPWYQHNHVNQDDPNGAATGDTYCYSADGTGTDCPTNISPPCTTPGKLDKWGDPFCEKAHHPTHNPWGSIGWSASVKNIVAVGSTDGARNLSGFSSRGPTKDGRVKPDLTAKGQSLTSTAPASFCGSAPCYARLQGTSMATPVVTGSMALLAEQWRKLNNGASPGPVILKGLAIAGADDLGNPGPDYSYGFGFLNTKASVDLIIADNGQGNRVKVGSAANGAQLDYPINVAQGSNLRVVLTWFDPEALPLNADQVTTKVLINDLDLKVVGPDGSTVLPYVLDPTKPNAPATHGVNTVDNTEEVEIPGAAAGTYHAIVSGTTVTANPPQQFVLVANSDFGQAAPPCVDITEPNSTPDTAYGPLPINSSVPASICSSDDVDYFRFTPNAAGPSTITVTASATPLTVTVSSAGAADITTTVAAGASQTLSTNVAPLTQVLVRVAPAGALGTSGAYTITANYPFNVPPRKRAAKH